MKPELFEKIIKKISNQYQLVNIETFTKDEKAYKKVRKPLATILFDDGYKDNIEYAAPILKKYNCPASFYIVTDSIDRNIPTWTYVIDYALQNTRRPLIELDYGYVPEDFKALSLKNGLSMLVKRLKPWMKSLPNSKRLEIMEAIIVQCNDIKIPNNQMLNWDEVRQLHNAGFVIGSHTDTHPMLAQLENEREIETELKTSFYKIGSQLGSAPEAISYPIGSYDKRVIALSKEAGYKLGLAVHQRFYKVEEDNLFAVPRIELYQQPWYKVNARISGVYSTINSFRK